MLAPSRIMFRRDDGSRALRKTRLGCKLASGLRKIHISTGQGRDLQNLLVSPWGCVLINAS